MKTATLASRNGNAMVLSVLILLALSSVGIVGVQHANTDLMVAANVTRAAQAAATGEAGLSHSLGVTGGQPTLYIQNIFVQNAGLPTDAVCDDADPDYRTTNTKRVRVAEYSTADPNPDPVAGAGDCCQHLATFDPGGAESGPALLRQQVAYQVYADHLHERKGQLGNDLEKAGCHQVFDFNVIGAIPESDSENVRTTLNSTTTVQVRVRARALVGPVKCTMRH